MPEKLAANDVRGSRLRKSRKWIHPVGWVAVVLVLAYGSFVVLDQASETEILGGTVIHTWRERGSYIGCQIRVDDGAVIVDTCLTMATSVRVTVRKGRRPISGLRTYEKMGSEPVSSALTVNV
jgi:hypothetical protein